MSIDIFISIYNESGTELEVSELVEDALGAEIDNDNLAEALTIACTIAEDKFQSADVDAYTK